MASILPFRRKRTFDSETTRVMGEAYDHAARHLLDRGQPSVVQEIIAKRIVHLTGSGQRDPEKLAELALQSLGMDSQR